MYQVQFVRSAMKEYRALPKSVRQRIDEVLEMLRINPTSEMLRFRKIRGRANHYRIRVGDYRLIYTTLKKQLIIEVIRVGHRKEVYRYF